MNSSLSLGSIAARKNLLTLQSMLLSRLSGTSGPGHAHLDNFFDHDINAANSLSQTALDIAESAGFEDAVQALINAKADVRAL